jgi:hypothetical protein
MLPDGLAFRPGSDLLFYGRAHRLQVETHLLQHVDSHPLTELDESEKQVLGAYVIVVKSVGLFPGERQHLLRARGVKLFMGSILIFLVRVGLQI